MLVPKNWNKLTISEQESWLVSRLQEYYDFENQIKMMLAKIRGGHKIEIKELEKN